MLEWVSVGYPTLLVTSEIGNPSNVKFFHFDDDGFYTYVQMLTKVDRHRLALRARSKYNVHVSDQQIINLMLSSFTCSLRISSENYKGAATRLSENPLQMHFSAPINSNYRRLAESKLEMSNGTENIRLRCKMEASAKKKLTNTLSITSEQMDQFGIEDKLFGNAAKEGVHSTYVTRQQMGLLSREMYSTLNIYEEYEMPEWNFDESFIQDFIRQTAEAALDAVPIDTALASMSKYMMDVSRDLAPDEIKRELSEILKIETRGGKKVVVANKDYSGRYATSVSSDIGVKAGGGGLGFHVNAAAKTASQLSNESEYRQKTESQQIAQINEHTKNGMQWEIEGNRIVPKSINAALVKRASLKKTLIFNRVKSLKVNATFVETFSTSTIQAMVSPLAQLNNRITELRTNTQLIKQRSDELSDQITVSVHTIKSVYICTKLQFLQYSR